MKRPVLAAFIGRSRLKFRWLMKAVSFIRAIDGSEKGKRSVHEGEV
jgi:hypothetical protein